jgi:putative ATP-dependent endonuclease of OLD family
MSTHSPQLASYIPLDKIQIMQDGFAFSLSQEFTKLDSADYVFLQRFLDSTKANLFFSRGVILVEGPAEALLIPVFATLLGKSLVDYGVSIVNVLGIGFSRYSKIFLRKDNPQKMIKTPVACITDLDIIPDEAIPICLKYPTKSEWPMKNDRNWKAESEFTTETKQAFIVEKKANRGNEQNVRTFIADHWTLEYDMACSGLQKYMLTPMASFYTQERKKIEITVIGNQDEKTVPALIYSYFSKGLISKAAFAQEFANTLLSINQNKHDVDWSKIIPKYIVDTINYVTTGIGE